MEVIKDARTKRREYEREYRKANAEQIRVRKAAWRAANPGTVTAQRNNWTANNLEQVRNYKRKYRQDPAYIQRERDYKQVYRSDPGNVAKERAAFAKWYANNLDKARQKAALWHQTHGERSRELSRAWYRANKDKALAHNSRRRALERQRLPIWFGEWDKFVIAEAFDLAQLRLVATQLEWHVDHLIPLRARKASGLHCAANVQVIPGVLNQSKHCRMWLINPLEWLRHV